MSPAGDGRPLPVAVYRRRRATAVLGLLAVVVIAVVAVVAVRSDDGDSNDAAAPSTSPSTRQSTESSSDRTTTTSFSLTSTTPPDQCRASAMPPADRAALLVFASTDASDGNMDEALALGVGGVFFTGTSRWLDGGGLVAAVDGLPRRPLVAMDEEGGRVQDLRDSLGTLPSARELAGRSPESIRAVAVEHGEQMAGLGLTMNFAPVLDLVDDERVGEQAIGDRSFSASPDVVSVAAGAFAQGLADAGVLPTYKHFPGHGRAAGDSHDVLPTTPPLASLESSDLQPYRTLLAPDRPRAAVMVGHLDIPGVTDGEPASLSRAAVTGVLREEMGFDGLVVTDDLGAMDAITDRATPPEAAARAVAAGADMVLVPLSQTPAVVARLTEAVRAGEIAEEQVTRSADRVLAAQQPTVCALS